MLKITILALGDKMPAWVIECSREYTKRLGEWARVQVVEIPLQKRSKSHGLARILEKEASQLLAAIPADAHVVALDVEGSAFSSSALAQHLEKITAHAGHLCFLIGGPEGLAPEVLARAQSRWSLSALTLPHPLVRVVLTEALYRAFSLLNNHPYHK
ncbi:rRNA large subunit methyltransferase [Legionella geestiana]|uniref:Ribosomal RNA large subunit methyltransferase H n=1 Tax=Legionella geestiana TaxID=45065 RepID=A0A0W0TYB7_9GAMM|nr:23S rRNA (pseudouridine(1915)-N(3))-methyltransferase RlmH [Legionella geestiana]KTD00709.1 rRNA large subunit methyltransferase [Legionella geestiana]QBS11570.1 23S rRNA (pseudouridine(1915)-N(3))-methyltransferase RlmH [Legionella geestiana]QDQ40822.1 23S rRNA (pseudouridine(1915)-N(3))-methyltransferase RlmH [Legionella geestiana]STX53756.1 rRNA large subunit methyltransferase [Legionella geestiana]